MNAQADLFLYEELLLLALRDRQGTLGINYIEQVLAGGILSEFLLAGRIEVSEGKKPIVTVLDDSPMGDPVLDDSLTRMARAKKEASLQSWVNKIAQNRYLKNDAAEQLCSRGILRSEERPRLLIFKKRVYPELDPQPEQDLIGRIEEAVFSDTATVPVHLAGLISLANGSGLLAQVLGKKGFKERKGRIHDIVNGDLVGDATRQSISALQTMLLAAVMIPVIVNT